MRFLFCAVAILVFFGLVITPSIGDVHGQFWRSPKNPTDSKSQFPIKPNPTPPTKTPSSTSTPSSSLQLQWGFKYSLNSIQGIAYPDNGKWVLLERGKPYTNTYFTNAEYDWIQFFFSMKAGKEGTYKGGRLLTVSIPDGKILYQNTKAEWTFTQKKYLPSATIGGGMITNNGKKIPAMTSITVEYTHNSFHP